MKARGYFLNYIKEYEENTIRVETDEVTFIRRKKFLTKLGQGIRIVMQFRIFL